MEVSPDHCERIEEILGWVTNKLQIKWNERVNYELIEKIIEFNIQDKTDYTSFWGK